MFYGSPSEYFWEDDFGETHSIPQGEGGEQGDAMMPLLYSVGQHEALQVAQRGMRDGADDSRTPPSSRCRVGGTPEEPWHASAARDLTRLVGSSLRHGGSCMMGARPEPREPGLRTKNKPEMDGSEAESLCPRICDSRKALLRSQEGPGAGLALSTCPVNQLTTLHSFSRSSCCVDCTFPLPCATAGVAFHLTLVATTVQLERVSGFWEGEVGPLRTLQRGSAAKQGAE